MPRKPRKAIARRTGFEETGLTPDQVHHLLFGFCLLDDCEPLYTRLGFPFRDDLERDAKLAQNMAFLLEYAKKLTDDEKSYLSGSFRQLRPYQPGERRRDGTPW